jgi:hypothetical protein
VFESIVVPSSSLSSNLRRVARTTVLGILDYKDESTVIHGIVSEKT